MTALLFIPLLIFALIVIFAPPPKKVENPEPEPEGCYHDFVTIKSIPSYDIDGDLYFSEKLSLKVCIKCSEVVDEIEGYKQSLILQKKREEERRAKALEIMEKKCD